MFSDIKTRWLGPSSLQITAQIVPPPVDVDYIDIDAVPITNPARMLPQESAIPFWVEDRRREEQFYKLAELEDKVNKLVEEYEHYLHIPCGLHCCADRWENQLTDVVWNAFAEMQQSVENAMFAFNKKFHRAAWRLYKYHGCNPQEFQVNVEEEDRIEYHAALFYDFRQDLDNLINPVREEDLPF